MPVLNGFFSEMNTENNIYRRYLLDDVAESELVGIEERFMTDDAAYDEMLAVEDELFYEYSESEMSQAERTVFKRKFLATRQGRDRLAFAGAFLETTSQLARESSYASTTEEQPGILRSIAAFFSFGRAMQFGMAAAALIIMIGVVGYLIRDQRMRNELAAIQQQQEADRLEREAQIAEKRRQQEEIENQLAAERNKSTVDEERIEKLETDKKKLETEIKERKRAGERSPNIAKPGGQSTIATLVISPGLFTRSDGVPMNQVKLSPSATRLQMSLLLKNVGEYASYGTIVTAVDTDQTILSRSGLKPSGRSRSRKLGITIPAKSLQRADYEITLTGTTKTGETEELTKYYFSVDK